MNDINDDGGFKIENNQITYYDIAMNITAVYDLYDYENNPTNTYIMSKVLNTHNEHTPSVIDKRGGSKIIENQQIVFNIDGNESARYDLFNENGQPTTNNIFEKRKV